MSKLPDDGDPFTNSGAKDNHQLNPGGPNKLVCGHKATYIAVKEGLSSKHVNKYLLCFSRNAILKLLHSWQRLHV